MPPSSSSGLAPLPILLAQSPFREDAAAIERDLIEVTHGMRDQLGSATDDVAAYNALGWVVIITVLVGAIVMGVVALQRSFSER